MNLLIGKQLKEEKERLYYAQNGLCPLCGNSLNPDIFSNHIDHDHSLDGPKAGKVRGLLCIYCNALEGQVFHKFNSSGLKSTTNISDWLENLIKYYNADLSKNPIHPQFINDKTKQFSRLNLDDMNDMAKMYNISFSEKEKKSSRVTTFKKGLKLYFKGNK